MDEIDKTIKSIDEKIEDNNTYIRYLEKRLKEIMEHDDLDHMEFLDQIALLQFKIDTIEQILAKRSS